MTSDLPRQPRLTDLVTVLAAPSAVVGGPDGDLGASAIHGYYVDDQRLLCRWVLQVDQRPVPALSHAQTDPATAEVVGLVDLVADPGATATGTAAPGVATAGLQLDTAGLVRRTRHVDRERLAEHVRIDSVVPARSTVTLRVASDGLSISDARAGRPARPTVAVPTADGGTWPDTPGVPRLRCDPPPESVRSDPTTGDLVLTWSAAPGPGRPWRLTTTVQADGAPPPPAAARWNWRVDTDDPALARLVDRSLADAAALVRADPEHPADRYVCAGSPWYLTLFGRDSVWAARMLLPVDPDLALGTLHALARRQGTVTDPATGEEPGKILHELRRPALSAFLPPRYYGTVDATAVWVVLLVEAWQWGADLARIRDLLPHLHAALGWLASRADGAAGPAPFCWYTPDIAGLVNQGWKDSADAVHDRAGRLMDGPVALAEVQGYAVQAAHGAARLLTALDDPAADRWRAWADRLTAAFRAAFWAADDLGRYPLLALGTEGRRADAVASNMGHLLGTGILDATEATAVARRLADPRMTSAHGLRTLASDSPRYHPVSYHNGSVWPHDTAVVVAGLVAEGHGDAAAPLARGIVAAGPGFDHRLPELWGGEVTGGGPGGSVPAPIPYPTACAPQAWAAGTVVHLVTAALGLRVDVPAGTVHLAPPRPALLGAMTVRGIRVAGGTLDVALAADGTATVLHAPPGVEVTTS